MTFDTVAQISLFDAGGKKTDKTAEIQWLNVEDIAPHPHNPRLFIREEVVETISSSLQEKGFDPCYAVLARPLGDSYQMISGHHRLEACKRAGVAKIAAWVREMSDKEAFLELKRANRQGELSPLEEGYHIEIGLEEYGFNLKAYIRGTGGKETDRIKATQRLQARKVQKACNTCYTHEIDDKFRCLYEISKAPQSDWPWLVASMLDESWNVKQCEAAAKAVNTISDIPEDFHQWLPPEHWKKQAIADLAVADRVNRWVGTAKECLDTLDDSRPIWQFDDEQQPYREVISPKRLFLERLPEMGHPSDKKINNIKAQVLALLDETDREYKQWLAIQESEDAARAAAEQAERELTERKLKYSPTGHYADIREVELEVESFDAVITDCPYLLSNGGVTVRSGKEVSVDKNFDDSEGVAISPEEWVPLAWDALKPGGALITTCTYHIRRRLEDVADSLGAQHIYELIWNVSNPPPLMAAHMPQPAHEYIFVAIKEGSRYYQGRDEYKKRFNISDTSVMTLPKCSGKERIGDHDTQKPLELYKRLITLYCPPEGSILEPFAGSGTTAVTAKMLGRCCTWVEKEQGFFDMASDRIASTPFHWET